MNQISQIFPYNCIVCKVDLSIVSYKNVCSQFDSERRFIIQSQTS